MAGVRGMHRLNNRRPAARDRLWQSMRILRSFRLPDLIATAEAGADNTQKYVRGLVLAGIVQETRPRDSGRKSGHAIYRLPRDLGPRAPVLRADGTTFDPNAGRVHAGGIAQKSRSGEAR